MSANTGNTASDSKQPTGITSITVAGFKSIRDEQTIDIRPLTILAGANSSGKSSMMQPLLLIKQTLEADFDPGALLLNGPNVRFTNAEQFLSRSLGSDPANEFRVGLTFADQRAVESRFVHRPGEGVEVSETTWTDEYGRYSIGPSLKQSDIRQSLPPKLLRSIEAALQPSERSLRWGIERDACFLSPVLFTTARPDEESSLGLTVLSANAHEMTKRINSLIHIPAQRGNPERVYQTTAVGRTFPGVFRDYTASVIAKWQASGHHSCSTLNDDLRDLGLSWKVEATRVSDAEVELRVGRLLKPAVGGGKDLVSVADVGFGVSQTLPILAALHVATPEHLVYIEQPELHLHPRAQVAMAGVLARAVKRGVRMVIETHSALLLLAVQSLVAEGEEGLTPDKVRLHWFTRSEEDGATTITSADLDEDGSFGDWPEDFGDVELEIEKRYLDAVEAKMSKR